MGARFRSTPIGELQTGNVILSNDNPEQEWTVIKIERRGVKRVTWRITWSNGRTTPHASKARFRVKTD